MVLLEKYPIHFVITKGRQSKLGDYRPPVLKKDRHRISINGTLNKYAFLITTLHEYAHLLVRVNNPKKRLSPHGTEWKNSFKDVMKPFLNETIFPLSILAVLESHMSNPKASSTADYLLMAALQQFDRPEEKGVILDNLSPNDHFILPNGWEMKAIKKDRKRWLCERQNDNRLYKVHPLTKVQKK